MSKGKAVLALGSKCESDDALWAWVKEHLGIAVPRRAVCQGHNAPFDYLWSAYHEPAKDLVVWAPRGGGKTRLGAAATLLDLLHKPGVAVRILGGSLEQSLRMWEHLLGDLEIVSEEDEIAGKIGARRVRLKTGSAAAVLTQSQRSVRGQRIQKLRCDEVEMFDDAVWTAAQLTTRSLEEDGVVKAAGVVEALSTMHEAGGLMERIVAAAPGRGTRVIKWCLMEVLAKCPPERECASCGLRAECQGRARTCEGFMGIDDAIAMKGRVSQETWDSEMLCRGVSVTGSVFGGFDPAVHVVDCEPPAGARWTLAIDFGYHNPFVCLWIAETADGQVLVVDEYVQKERTVAEHIVQMKARAWSAGAGGIKRVACDPAGGGANDQTAESNVTLLRRSGYKVHTRGSQIVDGVEMIRTGLRTALGEVRLHIHARCQQLIAALRGYHYRPGGGEKPVKDGTHDHAVDALRYFYVNRSRSGAVTKRSY